MIYRDFKDVFEIARHCYLAQDGQHAEIDSLHFCLPNGDWCNPCAPLVPGETWERSAKQIVKPPTSEYIFAFPLEDEIGYFVLKLEEETIIVERITREKALELTVEE